MKIFFQSIKAWLGKYKLVFAIIGTIIIVILACLFIICLYIYSNKPNKQADKLMIQTLTSENSRLDEENKLIKSQISVYEIEIKGYKKIIEVKNNELEQLAKEIVSIEIAISKLFDSTISTNIRSELKR